MCQPVVENSFGVLRKAQDERNKIEIAEKKSVQADSSTGSELKAIEEACREASLTVEGCRAFFNACYNLGTDAAASAPPLAENPPA